MKQYPKYKDSGIDWIGEIPEEWKISKIKFLAEYINGYAFKPTDWSDWGLKIIRIQNLTNSDASFNRYSSELEEKYRIEKGDILFSWSASLGIFVWDEQDAWLNQHIFKVIPYKSVIVKKFYFYQAKWFTEILEKSVHGSTMQHLTKDNFGGFEVSLPSLSEQQSIANYLDRKTHQIDTLIEKKQKLIALLKEQRAAIINQAVTKGLNTNVKLKDSGIEWLGAIPEHWDVKKLKHVITIKSGEGITREDINEEGTYEVYGGNGFLGFTEDYNVTNDTLIIGRVGAKCGNVHLVCGHKWVTDNALIAKTNQNYRFLFFLLTSMRLNNLANQNAQPLITGTMIKYQIAALPSIDEQDKIVENVESETMRFDTLLRNNQRQIELLKEYRTALISEVVTGKIDVRDSGEQEVRPS